MGTGPEPGLATIEVGSIASEKITLIVVEVADNPVAPSNGVTDNTAGAEPGLVVVEEPPPPPPHAATMMSGNEQNSKRTIFFIYPPLFSQVFSINVRQGFRKSYPLFDC